MKIKFELKENETGNYNLIGVFDNDFKYYFTEYDYKPTNEHLENDKALIMKAINNYRRCLISGISVVNEKIDYENNVIENLSMYKIGDYVEVISSYFTARIGLKGTISNINNSRTITVRHNNNVTLSYKWDELKKIEYLPKFQTGDFVQITSSGYIKFGIIMSIDYEQKTYQVSSGVDTFIYADHCISKLEIETFPDSREFKKGAIVQVRGKRHKYSGRYGVIIHGRIYPDSWCISFGKYFYDEYVYNQKNLKLI